MKSGQTLAWDATCPDTFAPSHMALAAREAGTVASQAIVRSCRSVLSTVTICPHGHRHQNFWSVWARGFVIPEGAGKADQG